MKHFLRFLYLRARDLIVSFGAPPYVVADHQAYLMTQHCYRLARAIRMADATATTAMFGTRATVSIAGKPYPFTRDRFNRVHLPLALRHRML